MKIQSIIFLFILVKIGFAEPPVVEWVKEYPLGSVGIFIDMLTLSSGDAVIAGTGWNSQTNPFFIARTNSDGKELWHKEFPWLGDWPNIKLCQDSSGAVLVVGNFSEKIEQNRLPWLFEMKLDQNGDTLWTDRWRDTLGSILKEVFSVNDGTANLVVRRQHGFRVVGRGGLLNLSREFEECGSAIARMQNGCWITSKTTCVSELFIPRSEGVPDLVYCVVQNYKYSPDGYLVGEGYYRCQPSGIRKILELPEGGFIMAGDTDPEHSGYGTAAMYFVKLNSKLDTVWTRQYPQGEYGWMWEGASDVFLRPHQSYLAISMIGLETTRSYDFYLSELDSSGNLLWNKSYGDGKIHVTCMRETPDGGLLLAGTKSPDLDHPCGNPCLIKLHF